MIDFIRELKLALQSISLKKSILLIVLGLLLFLSIKLFDVFEGKYVAYLSFKPHWEMAEDVEHDCTVYLESLRKNKNSLIKSFDNISVNSSKAKGVNVRRQFRIKIQVELKDSIDLSAQDSLLASFINNSVVNSKRAYKGRLVLENRLALVDSCLNDSNRLVENQLKSLVNMEWEKLNLKSHDNFILMKGRYKGELQNYLTVNYLDSFVDTIHFEENRMNRFSIGFIFLPLLIYLSLSYFKRELA